MLQGHLERFFIPEDNLLDVNYRELRHFFPRACYVYQFSDTTAWVEKRHALAHWRTDCL